MKKTITIIGMGWLGVPLAQKLKILGYHIKGSVTKLEKATALKKNGFDVYPIVFSEQGVQGNIEEVLKGTDVLVVMIPPGLRRNTGSDYVMKMSCLLTEIEKATITNCIFISSTSVYGNEQGNVTEKTLPKPENEAGRQLFQTEQLFFTSSGHTSIVRFGGLFGGSRQPVRYLAGRENLNGGNAPVNLIHRDDCVNIIVEIIKQKAYGYLFNGVHPSHPLKKLYYTQKAQELKLPPPQFSLSNNGIFKQVDSIHLYSILQYQFQQGL